MPDTLPKRSKLINTATVCASLLIELALAVTLFALSYHNYTTWWRTTHHLSRTNDLIIHTTLFIGMCAPLCAILGTGAGAAYYWRKRRMYGKYDVKMRRKGQGYWSDPSDSVEKELSIEALRVNAEIRRKNERERQEKEREEKRRSRGGGLQVGTFGFAASAKVENNQSTREPKRISFFSNP
ncbi:hypothetical protein DE146DRAFT_626264 [Phaeosphaeria sp. MPI-PUGE-AT-0046c]|nr:hypothetical protein DE146DRAFT_626264 [Phaeosphaeria sp. MPI-PUGE-AT-0046c]